MLTTGEKIKEARIEKELTQQELGDLVGVSKHSIIKYEKNEREPNLETLTNIINVLDIDFWDIAPVDKIELDPAPPYEEGQRFYEAVIERLRKKNELNEIRYNFEEYEKLKMILTGRQIKKINKKYNTAKDDLLKELLSIEAFDGDDEILLYSKFIEFEKEYFLKLHDTLNTVIKGSMDSLKSDLRRFIDVRSRAKVTEVILLIKDIFEINYIKYAVLGEYLRERENFNVTGIIKIAICKEDLPRIKEIFRLIAKEDCELNYIINEVKIKFVLNVTKGNEVYTLTEDNIKYCIIEGKRIPVLQYKNGFIDVIK